MKDSDDMQKDTSTGVGGKKVESDDTHFSLSDAGKWKDEYAKRMEKPQKKQYIVERQGDKMDPKVAAMLREISGASEQLSLSSQQMANTSEETGPIGDCSSWNPLD